MSNKPRNTYVRPHSHRNSPIKNRKDRLMSEDRGRYQDDPTKVTNLDNVGEFRYQPFMSAMAYFNSYFKRSLDEDFFIENGIHCLNEKIGNKHTAIYAYVGMTDKKGVLCLPYEAEAIIYVSNGIEDFNTWSYYSDVHQLYAPGGYVAFNFLGDRIVTNYFEEYLSVLYRAVRLGEDMLPEITQPEAIAIAHWCNFVDLDAGVFASKIDPGLADRALLRANTSIMQAKVPGKFSQNFLDNLYDIIYSRDGKVYNKSLKMIKTA